jgi:hypothetical protein
MLDKGTHLSRRRFLQSVAVSGAAIAAPQLIPASALGKDGAVAASERILVGGIGIGSRGSYDLGFFLSTPEVQFTSVCDVRADRRESVKRRVDEHYGNQKCVIYRDFRDLLDKSGVDAVLIATGSNWHCLLSIYSAKAGKDVYCEKPCTKNIAESIALADAFRRTGRVFQGGMQRRNLPHMAFAVELARSGKLGKLKTLYAHPGGLATQTSGWNEAMPEPPKEQVDWDMFLGSAAWRPYNPGLLNSGFEKGGGMVGGGNLEWGSHCADLCQWANDADDTAPVEYSPVAKDGTASALYANGVKLVLRNDGWLPLGSCPVRFEGETGWVETGDTAKVAVSSPTLLAGKKIAEIAGYPPSFHIREFLDCVKSRGKPRANYQVACQSHIACHASNIAMFLNRTLKYDPVKNEFIGDDEANRLRSEAMRAPWHT